jgi:hypothetical protein
MNAAEVLSHQSQKTAVFALWGPKRSDKIREAEEAAAAPMLPRTLVVAAVVILSTTATNAGRQPLADSHCPPTRCCRRRRTCRPRGMPTRDSRRQHVYSPTRRNTMLASGWQRRSTQRALRPRVTTRLPRSPHRRHVSRLGIRGQGGSCTSTWSWAWPGLVRCRGSRTAASLFLRYTDGTLIDDDAGPTTVQAFWDDRL